MCEKVVISLDKQENQWGNVDHAWWTSEHIAPSWSLQATAYRTRYDRSITESTI